MAAFGRLRSEPGGRFRPGADVGLLRSGHRKRNELPFSLFVTFTPRRSAKVRKAAFPTGFPARKAAVVTVSFAMRGHRRPSLTTVGRAPTRKSARR